MSLSGTWTITEQWEGEPKPYNFTVTFNENGTVTIDGHSDGFAMVWYNGAQPGQQGVILAGDNRLLGILAVYYGTIGPDNMSMSGSANGKMGILGGHKPVSGTWKAVQTS